MGTHYSNVQNTSDLKWHADKWGDEVIKECTGSNKKQKLFPVFVYRGMSGVGSATALALAIHNQDPDFGFGMVYVRKEHEGSHGSDIEHNMDCHDGLLRKRLYFVDDFTSTGESFARAMRPAFKRFGPLRGKFDASKIGLIEMNKAVHDSIKQRDNSDLNSTFNGMSKEC